MSTPVLTEVVPKTDANPTVRFGAQLASCCRTLISKWQFRIFVQESGGAWLWIV